MQRARMFSDSQKLTAALLDDIEVNVYVKSADRRYLYLTSPTLAFGHRCAGRREIPTALCKRSLLHSRFGGFLLRRGWLRRRLATATRAVLSTGKQALPALLPPH